VAALQDPGSVYAPDVDYDGTTELEEEWNYGDYRLSADGQWIVKSTDPTADEGSKLSSTHRLIVHSTHIMPGDFAPIHLSSAVHRGTRAGSRSGRRSRCSELLEKKKAERVAAAALRLAKQTYEEAVTKWWTENKSVLEVLPLRVPHATPPVFPRFFHAFSFPLCRRI